MSVSLSSSSLVTPAFLRRGSRSHCLRPVTAKFSADDKNNTTTTSKSGPSSTSSKQSSWVSPDWLTSLARSLTLSGNDESGIPIASAQLDDVSDLLGGALFLPLFKWMNEYGPIYRLAAGPRNFVVVSDPAIAKHVLRNYGKYAKGLVAEVSEFLFGSGFAIAEGPLWTVTQILLLLCFDNAVALFLLIGIHLKCIDGSVN